jgi:hypothetical protein
MGPERLVFRDEGGQAIDDEGTGARPAGDVSLGVQLFVGLLDGDSGDAQLFGEMAC